VNLRSLVYYSTDPELPLLHSKPSQLLNFESDADADLDVDSAFYFDADPDPQHWWHHYGRVCVCGGGGVPRFHHRLDRVSGLWSSRPKWPNTPHHPQASVAPPPLASRGRHTRLRGRDGEGDLIPTKGQTLW
jgi:hypothetical protein